MRHSLHIAAALCCLVFSCAPAPVQETGLHADAERWPCFNGCYIVLQEGKYALESEQGAVLLPPVYSAIEFLDNDTALASDGERALLCSRTGRILCPPASPDSLRSHYAEIVEQVREQDRRSWEQVVEHYAALCKAGKSHRGHRLSRGEYAALKTQADRVEESLRHVSGSPTPSQEARLEALSNDYRRAFR